MGSLGHMINGIGSKEFMRNTETVGNSQRGTVQVIPLPALYCVQETSSFLKKSYLNHIILHSTLLG